MDFLNSQHLTAQDGYLHVFRQPGVYRYGIGRIDTEFDATGGEADFVIEVTEGASQPGDGVQYEVVVRWDAATRQLIPEPARLSLATNDFVLWRVEGATPGFPPYRVRGLGPDQRAFDSRSLGQHDVFTHLFMTPGEYRYSVLGKGQGSVSVRDHRQVPPEVAERLAAEAPLVSITGLQPDPPRVEIITGQTVIWLVVQGDQATIASLSDSPTSVGG